MRPDMDKVLCENARVGHTSHFKYWRRDKKYQVQLEGEGMDLESCSAIRESMTHRYNIGYNRKELNENLSPLRRFIESRCGELWDDVYSDICSTFSMNTTVEQHILLHVEQYVHTNTVMHEIDGVMRVCHRGYYGNGLYPIDESHWYDFYVHPETGILTKSKYVSYRTKRKQEKAAKEKNKHILQLGKWEYLISRDGIWYQVQYAPQRIYYYSTVNHSYYGGRNPNIAQQTVFYNTSSKKYQTDAFGNNATNEEGGYVAIRKRQLNYRQLKKYNLEEFASE